MNMLAKQKVLVVEDEADISELISVQLQSLGLDVDIIDNGDEALKIIQDEGQQFDLFVLDRMLPGASGLEILKFIRLYNKTKYHPVLFVTALTGPEQITEGLDAGADDYITKPFDLNILKARINALVRRINRPSAINKDSSSTLLSLHDIKVDQDQCKAWKGEDALDLTKSEYRLLCKFLTNMGKVFTRRQLMDEVQENNVHVTERTIDTHVFGLRKKLGESSSIIETIRGIGYRIVNE